MSKYIKLEDIKYRDVLYTFATNEELLVATEEDIESLPTIEIREGEWVEDEYGISRCSECNCINNTFYRNYCPNCGARMESDK